MKTVSILQYDHEEHQFCPSFVIHDDLENADNECAFDEWCIQPSAEWMEDYLEWNRFGRLPDDPAEEDNPIPTFSSLQELHQFNRRGYDLTQRLSVELAQVKCIQVAPFCPLYSNMVVGPIAAWWHVKDCNYGFVVPVQRLPVSNTLKSRLQAFRCHKGMEFWSSNDPDTMTQLQEEGRLLQEDLLRELSSSKERTARPLSGAKQGGIVPRTSSIASIGALLEQSCTLLAGTTSTTSCFQRTSSIASIGALLEQSCTLAAASAPTTTKATSAAKDKGSFLPRVQARCH